MSEMTLEQWADLPEDAEGELVDGRLVEEEVPSLIHETVVVWLVFALRTWLKPLGGRVFASEGKYAVREDGSQTGCGRIFRRPKTGSSRRRAIATGHCCGGGQ